MTALDATVRPGAPVQPLAALLTVGPDDEAAARARRLLAARRWHRRNELATRRAARARTLR